MNMRDAVLNQKDIGDISVVLDCRRRNQDYILQRFQQQTGIHEQVGKERVVFVVEDCRAVSGFLLWCRFDYRWLCSFPAASFVCSERSYASTASGLPFRICCSSSPTLSSGIVKTTVMGCNWVMTTNGVVLEATARLPGSTRRRPTRPEMGEVMLHQRQLHLVVLQSPLIGFDCPSVL